jgi:two-component system response regulator (stage 0 sporulation protein A)
MERQIKLLVSSSNNSFTAFLTEPISSDPMVKIVKLTQKNLSLDIPNLNDMCPHVQFISPVFNEASTSLEARITDVLNTLGLPAHIKGFHYVRKAIVVTMESGGTISAVTKILYPFVAKTYNTTPSRVERAIRHAIEVAWERCEAKAFRSIFRHSIRGEIQRPTNSEFIARIADYLQMRPVNE